MPKVGSYAQRVSSDRGWGSIPRLWGRSGDARRCHRPRRHFLVLLLAVWVAASGSAAIANDEITAAAMAAIDSCLTGEGTLNSLPLYEGWVPIPRKGPLTSRFSALETEGTDIGNQHAVKRDAREFENRTLFLTRKLMIYEENGDAVSFAGSDAPGEVRLCFLTFTYASPFEQIVEKYADQFPKRRDENETNIYFYDNHGSVSWPTSVSVTMMPDRSSRPISGAMLQVSTSVPLKK